MHARTKVTVRYAETDKMGIAHHSNYPIWYEIARNDYIKMFGISYTDMENAGVMTPLLNLSCHFGIPALYEDELIIRTWVQTITAARIIFTYKNRKYVRKNIVILLLILYTITKFSPEKAAPIHFKNFWGSY